MQGRALELKRSLRAGSLGLPDDDRAFHDGVKCTGIGKIPCLLEGMSPSGIRSDGPRIERSRRDRMRGDILVFPFHGIASFNLNCRRRKFHVFHGHMRDRWRVGVCDRALDGARGSSARLNSFQSRLGW